jgi:outer membrane protein TolC
MFRSRTLSVAVAIFLVTACAVGPDYKRPKFDAAAGYKEQSGWKPSEPNDALSRGAWWTIFNDETLSELESKIDISNENVKAAAAAYDQARAMVEQAQAGFWPTVALSASRQRGSERTGTLPGGSTVSFNTPNNTQTTNTVGVTADWTLDIWGQIRRTVESNRASAQASAAALAAAKLSAQAALATDYFELRAQDQLERLLNDTVAAEQLSLKITQSRYRFGVAAKADVVSAEAQLLSSQAQQINAKIDRKSVV